MAHGLRLRCPLPRFRDEINDFDVRDDLSIALRKPSRTEYRECVKLPVPVGSDQLETLQGGTNIPLFVIP